MRGATGCLAGAWYNFRYAIYELRLRMSEPDGRFDPDGVRAGQAFFTEAHETKTWKLRNEPNFSAKKPMKVHKCPKKRTQFKATGEAGFTKNPGESDQIKPNQTCSRDE
ncbi:MAG TPA: hypothetical protein VK742_02420, partial [Candidatus Sulfotelmatobacter sp.]|nr:hypothetical protein [Candidatus Sulfotelmatobacter sp.]